MKSQEFPTAELGKANGGSPAQRQTPAASIPQERKECGRTGPEGQRCLLTPLVLSQLPGASMAIPRNTLTKPRAPDPARDNAELRGCSQITLPCSYSPAPMGSLCSSVLELIQGPEAGHPQVPHNRSSSQLHLQEQGPRQEPCPEQLPVGTRHQPTPRQHQLGSSFPRSRKGARAAPASRLEASASPPGSKARGSLSAMDGAGLHRGG